MMPRILRLRVFYSQFMLVHPRCVVSNRKNESGGHVEKIATRYFLNRDLEYCEECKIIDHILHRIQDYRNIKCRFF